MKKLIILDICIIILCAAAIALADTKSILVIQSYAQDMPWTGQCEQGIRNALGTRYQLHYFYMDTKRVPTSEFQARADAAWAEYEKIAPALVMIGDDNGLRLLGPRFAKTKTPVVYFGINNNPRSYFDVMPINVSGVLERMPLFPWLRYLKMLMPQARKALVLLDTSPTTEAVLAVTFKDRDVVNVTGIETKYRIAESWEQWQEIAREPGQYDLIVIPTYHTLRDSTGNHIKVEDAVEWTSANSPVPLFALQDYAVGPKGAVGSYVVFGETQGQLAGEIALKILEKHLVPKEILPAMGKEGKFFFNEQQLARFNLVLPVAIRQQTIFK